MYTYYAFNEHHLLQRKARLSKDMQAEQRHFFQQIAALAFVNPFSKQRERADCELLGIGYGSMDLMHRLERIQPLLAAQLIKQQPLNEFRIQHFQGKELETMKFAWLFYQFHEFQALFNQFIAEQNKAGDKPIVLPFSQTISQCFLQAGFTHAEAEKYIALFYQLHRGFYFINSAITGNCPSIIELRMRLWNNIFTFNPQWYLDYLCEKMEDFSTLLLGKTGTGKSLAAMAIGQSGFIPFDLARKRFKTSFTRSFQSINLSQYPASLLESELFGHKKGAFTGAIEHHQGLFARCSIHGAVFIDEIGDIDLPTQVKLLNVIQDRTFSPVGSHEKLRFSGRVISATNRNINKLRQQGRFRDDLYYRLCSDVIEVPGLQQRLQENQQELDVLISSLLKRIISTPDESRVTKIEQEIRRRIPKNYAWPGNVRELEQCIRRICLTGHYGIQAITHSTQTQTGFSLPELSAEPNAKNLLQHYCQFLYARHNSYQTVARITGLDRRTVKKNIMANSDIN